MMLVLGDLGHGTRRLATRAAALLPEHGEIAVFISLRTRCAAALTYSDMDYRRVLDRNARHLVGVYRDDLRDNVGLVRQIMDDMAAHVSRQREVA